MRKIFATILLILGLLVFLPVVNAQAAVFKCYASSNYAYGYGWATNSVTASTIALRECAVNTPPYDVCYVRWCIRER
jgi:hypothetical protein